MTPATLEVYADRSRIVQRQKCPKSRFLGYHYNGTGLTKRDSGYEALFGQILHECLAEVLKQGRYTPHIGISGVNKLTSVITDHFKSALIQTPGAFTHMLNEQTYLLMLLVYGWAQHRLRIVLDQYTVVSVEDEQRIVFAPGDYLPPAIADNLRPWKFPLRRDALLRDKDSGNLLILDFKSASQTGEDWNVNLDNSLQTHLYIEATERLNDGYVIGVQYEGLVKGHRQVDRARSSPFNGFTIQYGSFLYGWEGKDGRLFKDYSSGRQRVFLPGTLDSPTLAQVWELLIEVGWNLSEFFPSTIPYRPLNTPVVVGQQIVNENMFANNLEFYESLPVGSADRQWYEQILFEQNLDSCFKYGKRHPCQFCEICHGGIHEDEIKQVYIPRVDHHSDPVE